MTKLTIEESREKLNQGVEDVKKMCQDGGFTIENCDGPVNLVFHYKDLFGHSTTVSRTLITTPF